MSSNQLKPLCEVTACQHPPRGTQGPASQGFSRNAEAFRPRSSSDTSGCMGRPVAVGCFVTLRRKKKNPSGVFLFTFFSAIISLPLQEPVLQELNN